MEAATLNLDEKTPLINQSEKVKVKGVPIANSVKLTNTKEELSLLKSRIDVVRKMRAHYYTLYKNAHKFFKVLVTLITAAAMIINIVEVDENIRDYISIAAFICTLSTWGDLDRRATEHLTATNDLQSAMNVVDKCSDKIKVIQEDGIVTQQEQKQIDNIEEELEKQLEALSFYSHMVDVISSASEDEDVKTLYKEINTVVQKCNKKTKENLL